MPKRRNILFKFYNCQSPGEMTGHKSIKEEILKYSYLLGFYKEKVPDNAK